MEEKDITQKKVYKHVETVYNLMILQIIFLICASPVLVLNLFLEPTVDNLGLYFLISSLLGPHFYSCLYVVRNIHELNDKEIVKSFFHYFTQFFFQSFIQTFLFFLILWVLIIDFIYVSQFKFAFVVLMMITLLVYLYVSILSTNFKFRFRDLIRLTCLYFLTDWVTLIKLVSITITVGLICSKYPLMFFSTGVSLGCFLLRDAMKFVIQEVERKYT